MAHSFSSISKNAAYFFLPMWKELMFLVVHFLFQTTVASEFLLLQESVQDVVDLYLSLKFSPVILANDTPCGFARHLDLRKPIVCNQLWGDCMGCFEKPSLDTDPMQVKDSSIFVHWFVHQHHWSEFWPHWHATFHVKVYWRCISQPSDSMSRPKHFLNNSICPWHCRKVRSFREINFSDLLFWIFRMFNLHPRLSRQGHPQVQLLL